MLMPIPEVRRRLHQIAEEYGIDELHDLAEATRRRSPVKRAEQTSRPMDPKLAAAIHAYWVANPDASNQQIAGVFNVNIGRISDVLNEGKWL